ncbi:MAG: SDR family NAD(P)-dependent oxidoreductase [Pseudomonadota bacterium]
MKNSLIAITGASSGIGKAIAEVFSQAGYKLLLLARRVDVLEQMALPNSICRKLDVSDYHAFKTIIADVEKNIGPVTGLINNAGIIKTGNYEEIDNADHQRIIDVNLKGVINGCSAVLEFMRQRKSGTILNIGALNYLAIPSSAVYCASKDAVRSLTCHYGRNTPRKISELDNCKSPG